jgi:molybdopterin converting factor subunit 1
VVVKVLFFGVLKDLTGLSEETVEAAPATTIGELFDRYAQRFETLKAARPSILLARNREFSTPDTPLTDQDEIAFLPPVSGGSTPLSSATGGKAGFLSFIEDESGSLFALTRRPIESQALADELQRGEDGAVIVFEGIVRNNTKARATRYLEYECYEPMALAGLARIGREIAAERTIGRIALIHRLGRLEIGEASVAVVVTAPHRKPAFEAALDGINRLKREVPIWKKEFFEDGAVWVEGEWDDRLPGRAKTS